MVDRKLIRNIALLTLGLVIFGTLGLSTTAHLPYGESFYETVTLLLTHVDHYGFKEPGSRYIVVILVISSIVVVAYLLKVLADYIVGLGDGLKRHHMKAKIARLKNHYIICGLGRVGAQVADELFDEGVPFVAVDHSEERVKAAIAKGYIAILGDSTKEEALQSLAIERAQGLVASLGEDSANLFVTLASRQLNPRIFIVARVNREENRQRMIRAGADRTTMPYQIGGYHMATMLTRPSAVDFLEILSANNNSQLRVEEVTIPDHSAAAGKHLGWLYNHKVGATILAVNTHDGMSKVNPSGNETLYSGDKLIVMGTAEQVEQMSSLV